MSPAPSLGPAVERLVEEMEAWHVPGLELAVVRDGEVLHAGGLGVRGVEDPEPVGPRTWFHHGSCGKALTGLLASLLAAEGLLDLDAPVRRYLPELVLPDPVIAERVTTRDLLAHRSGLARHDLAWIANPSCSRTDMVRGLASLPMAGDIRARWLYSNFGYMTAGLVIGRVTDSTWEEQLRIRLLEPTGMVRTSSSAERVMADDDRARPHLLRDEKAVPTGYRWLDAASPAGGLLGCAEDSARWLLLQTAEGDGALPRSAVTDTHQVQMAVPGTTLPLPGMRVHGYGLGWVIGTLRGRPMVWHNGGIDGFRTDTLLLPEERIGVLVSVSLHASSISLAAALDVVDGMLGQEPDVSWYDVLRPNSSEPDPEAASTPMPGTEADAAAAEAADGGDGRTVEQAGGGTPEEPGSAAGAAGQKRRGPSHEERDFAGVYVHPGYGTLAVDLGEGGLACRLGELELDATHRHYDTWDLAYAPLDLELAVTFVTGPDGVVSEAVLPLDPECPPIRFGRAAAGAAPAEAGSGT